MRTMENEYIEAYYSLVCTQNGNKFDMNRALSKEDEVGRDQIEGLECRVKDFEFDSVDQYFSNWIPLSP